MPLNIGTTAYLIFVCLVRSFTPETGRRSKYTNNQSIVLLFLLHMKLILIVSLIPLLLDFHFLYVVIRACFGIMAANRSEDDSDAIIHETPKKKTENYP